MAAANVANAQQEDKGKAFRLGLKISPNIAWIHSDTKFNNAQGLRLGFSYGAMADFRLNSNNNYAFSIEVLLSSMGGQSSYDSALYNSTDVNGNSIIEKNNNVGYAYKLRYLQIPLTIKMKTDEIGYITYWGQFGLVASFLIKARADVERSPLKPDTDVDNLDINTAANYLNFKDDIDFFRASILFGAGIEYKLTESASAYSGLRFDGGFTDIFKDANIKGNNSVVSLNLGIFF